LATVYLGTSQFAATILERLAGDQRHRPALVLTRPDRPSGRGRKLSSPPVAETAQRLGLALEQPAKVNESEVVELIAQAAATGGSPPVLIVCAFGALIAEPLLSAQEILNVHPSLLPRWRGAAPIERAIMAGDEQTGVSIMRLTAGLDSGPVCATKAEPIGPGDTFGSLAPRLARVGAELLLEVLDRSPPFVEQDERGVTYAEKIAPPDRLLDPQSSSAIELERTVRALDPHIGARLAIGKGDPLRVCEAKALAGEEQPAPGEVAVQDGRLLVGCHTGVLELLQVQPPGGRPMDAAAYLRGHGDPATRL
jgi:methionyl-tRNA formyltransferase